MGLKAVMVIPAVSTIVIVSPSTIPAASGITVAIVNGGGAVSLPASPAPNQIVIVQDGDASAGASPIVVAGNGHNIDVPQSGASATYVIGANGTDAWFNWKAGSSTWGILA